MAQQERVLVSGEKPDDQDVQTQVTYQDIDQTGQPIKVGGVDMAPGQSVDLAEMLPKAEAQRMARKLSRNPYFKVAGSEDEAADMRKLEQARAEQSSKAQQEAQRLQQERRKREWEAQNPGNQQEAQAQRQNTNMGQAVQSEEPPPGVGEPNEARLETEGPRGGRAARKG